MAWDVRGNGKDIVRAGWGIYYDFGYTNANILFAGAERAGRVRAACSLIGYRQGPAAASGQLAS